MSLDLNFFIKGASITEHDMRVYLTTNLGIANENNSNQCSNKILTTESHIIN